MFSLFLFSKENLRSFVGPGFEDLNGMDDRKTSILSGDDYVGEKRFLCLSLDFSKIWKVLDEPHSSKYAKVGSNVRRIGLEVLCKTDVLKNFAKLPQFFV